ncbi:MAG: TraB/GumN family protein [Spirochaetaceae bacterium]
MDYGVETSGARTTIEVAGKRITIIGTAHISQESVADVTAAIEELAPERVCVEIDEARYRAMTEGQDWSRLDVYRVLRERKGFLLLGNLVLQSFQRRMGEELGVRPGEEMREAVRVAEERSVPVALCDRDIQVTLRRAWAGTGFWGKNKMLAALLSSLFTREKLTEEEIEELKQKTALQGMMEELAAYLPQAKEVLIDERDKYLAKRIFEQPEQNIVAVVGAGHVSGIVRHLQWLEEDPEAVDLEELDLIPPKKAVTRALPYLVPAVVIGLLGWGFVQSGWQGGIELFMRWVLVNGSLSAVGALAALAHPLTVIVSFLAAPFTSMNPTIGVGIVAGLLEAVLRKPRVLDFENLQQDILSVRGFFRNRVSHVLLVFFFSSLGSAVGTFVAFPFLFPGSV